MMVTRAASTNVQDGIQSILNTETQTYPTNKLLPLTMDWLLLVLLYQTQRGYFNRETLEGSITRFIATDNLLSLFLKIRENPFVVIKPNPDAQCIIMRDDVDGQKKQVEYLETPAVTEMRNNLRLINRCLSKHYPDIRIKDDDWILRKKIMVDPDKCPIDWTTPIWPK